MQDENSKPEQRGAVNASRPDIVALVRKMTGRQQRRTIGHGPFGAPAPSQKADFTTLEIYQQMKKQRAAAEIAHLRNPYFRILEGHAGATAVIDGREYVNFAAYDYLGLNAHPKVAAAAEQAIRQYGTSASASRPTAGNRELHRKLETQLAMLHDADDALVFVSGHSTNVSTIGDLMGPNDLIIYDALSHNSIMVGAKLSGAARRRYAHNDLDELANVLAETRKRYDRVLIVVEGHYSMDGDLPDLPRLIELKNRYGAWLMVDEAHSLGVLGRTGRGVAEHFGVDPRDVDIWMGTLSKTLCGCGGYIAGCSALIEILKYFASGFMFSVGMAPPLAAASSCALELMLAEPERVTRLQDNGRFFLHAARLAGLNTLTSSGHSIVPILVGDSLRAAKLSNVLMERGIFTIPVTYPAVPMQRARIRFFITSQHTREQMQTAIDATADELRLLVKANFGVAHLIGKI